MSQLSQKHRIIKMNGKQDKTIEITIGDLIEKYNNGEIIPYKHNRGTAGYAKKTINTVRDELHLPSLGKWVGCRNETGELVLADCHSRTIGLVERERIGTMTDEEKNYKISFSIIPKEEFLTTYQMLNSGKQHTAMNNLENPDYFFGNIINNLLEEIGNDAIYFRRSSNRTNLAYLIYTYATGGKINFYRDVFVQRKYVTELQKCKATDKIIDFPNTLKDKLVSAMHFYADFIKHLQALSKERGIDVSKITKSGPFMAMIIMDQMKENSRYSKYKTLVDKVLNKNHFIALSSIIPHITGSSADSILANENEIWEILRRKLVK